ncbi:hypothetical protein HHI36_015029 [Cryptolaemus montrouzieri]|uniref:THAP-type domain-containing protein n=1 Tax=Cryptolaemus montrouzieri TaxID=559131 RepID=A0ABD2N575_9CUCU
MGGCRCSYKNCRNTTKTTDNVHFFHYPVKQKDRCKIWIKRAEKPQFFDLDEYQLRNKVICEVHFEDHCFLNSQKKRLLPNAVPSIDGDTCYEIEAPSAALPKPKDRFKQFSTRMDDIQILPASEDGSLFVLDTFPSYKVSKEVKSYILNNDALLPLGENNEPKIKTELMDEENEMDANSEFILSDDGHFNVFHNKSNAAPLKTIAEPQVSKYKLEKSDTSKKSSFDSGCNSSASQSLNSPSKNISDEMLESMICKTVESKYLHKLEQHTKDLNQIKKALRLSKSASKLNKVSVLRFLKLRLPPSLYTLVNLSIDDDYNLSEEDETFFKNLHDSSPRAYQFLMDDCNWRMPIIEIHEGDPDSMDDT